MPYTPPQEILARYAEVMVNYGLGNGAGINRGDVVGLDCAEDAKPLLLEVAKAVWRARRGAVCSRSTPPMPTATG